MYIVVLGTLGELNQRAAQLIEMMGAQPCPMPPKPGGMTIDTRGSNAAQTPVGTINEALLNAIGCSWRDLADYCPERLRDEAPSPVRREIERLVAALDQNAVWVFNDPRLSLTLPIWRPYLQPLRPVLAISSPLASVVDGATGKALPALHAASLWEHYAVSALRVSAGQDRSVVEDLALRNDPASTVDSLNRVLRDTAPTVLQSLSRHQIANVIRSMDVVDTQDPPALEDSLLTAGQSRLRVALRDGAALMWRSVPDVGLSARQTMEMVQEVERHRNTVQTQPSHPSRQTRSAAWVRLAESISATQASWRWRIGDRLIRVIEILLRRPRPALALDEAARLARELSNAEADATGTLGNAQTEVAAQRPTASPPGSPALMSALGGGALSTAAALPVPKAFQNWRFVFGCCNVCGRDARFFYSDERLVREQLSCEHCGSTSRYRSIARGILRAINERAAVAATSLASLPQTGIDRQIRIYDTQQPFRFDVCAYPLPELLGDCNWIDLALSTYDGTKPKGSMVTNGVWNENLEQLTFADESFDIVITSDVMEHVRLDQRAHAEIARVLKPGGIYLFTVPHNWSWPQTLVRVEVNNPADPSSDYYRLPPEYHGDANSPGGQGVLSYRAYGRDLEQALVGLGFSFNYDKTDYPENAIKNTELFYCQRAYPIA